MILTTQRLTLRELVEQDEAAMFQVFADPYARTFYERMGDVGEVGAWIGWSRKNYALHGMGLWAVEREGQLIGDCGPIWQTIDGGKELEVGYHIAEPHRRQGYASEATRAVIQWCFDNRDVQRVISLVHVDNIASATVAARVHTTRRPAVVAFHEMPHWVFETPR